MLKNLYNQQNKFSEKVKNIFMKSKLSLTRIKVLNTKAKIGTRPFIIFDKNQINSKLMANGIINSKKNPCCKVSITCNSDYAIVLYFKRISNKLLSYYRCADNFYKMKNIVNWFIRYSAISTLKHRHKLASRKMVINKYGINLVSENYKGNIVNLIPREKVNILKKKYLFYPGICWL